MTYFKSIFASLLAPHIPELSEQEIFDLIEVPPQGLGADLAFPCFGLSKTRKQSPMDISREIQNKYSTFEGPWKSSKFPDGIKNIYGDYPRGFQNTGPYINITFTPEFVLRRLWENSNISE